MSISLLCVSLLAFLVIALALVIFVIRFKNNVMYGYATDPENILYRAIRAHGNATEYVPVIALLIYILGTMPISYWVFWCMILITAFRYMTAAGILIPKTMAKPNPFRLIGTLGTYITGFGLCTALLLKALNA